MKKVIDLAFRKAKGRVNANLYADESDEMPYDIVKTLRELFDNAKDGMVMVRIIADDRKEKEVPFDIETAREIIDGKTKGRFVDMNGNDVEVISAGLKGDHPLLGIYEGEPVQWDIQGAMKDGDDSCPVRRIKILICNNTKGTKA